MKIIRIIEPEQEIQWEAGFYDRAGKWHGYPMSGPPPEQEIQSQDGQRVGLVGWLLLAFCFGLAAVDALAEKVKGWFR